MLCDFHRHDLCLHNVHTAQCLSESSPSNTISLLLLCIEQTHANIYSSSVVFNLHNIRPLAECFLFLFKVLYTKMGPYLPVSISNSGISLLY